MKELYVPKLADIASHFEGARISGYTAECPACGADSLRIFSSPYIASAVQVKCGAGCSRNVVLGKIGLSASALYPQGPTRIAPVAPATSEKAVTNG